MSMLAVVSNWLTPTSLVVFLNLVIGTIVVTARFTPHKKPPPHQHKHHQQLARGPSLLERVRSFDLYGYKRSPFTSPSETQTATYFWHVSDSEHTAHDGPPQIERVPSLLERIQSIQFSSFYRSAPETEPAAQADTDPFLNTGNSSNSGVEHLVERSISESRVVPRRHAQEKTKKSASEKKVPGLLGLLVLYYVHI
uniref:DUF4408 domain-containing protein n=1 Tax=Rhizophora mucronata TaxID=61149 RepID=A0A2P2JYR0_RHIMU